MSLVSAAEYGLNSQLSIDGTPVTIYGDKLLANNGNGDSYGEMSLRSETSDIEADQMLLLAEIARGVDQYGAQGVITELEHYLELVSQSTHELEGQHPRFSGMLDEWAHNELVRATAESKTDSSDSDVASQEIEDLTLAHIYANLRTEIQEDYAQAINVDHDLKAQAEWDVIQSLIDERVDQHMVSGVISQFKRDHALAA